MKRGFLSILVSLFLGFCLIPGPGDLSAQTIQVVDSVTGEPLSYSRITVKTGESPAKLKWGAITDIEGKAKVQAETEDTDRIIISLMGYEPYSGKIVDLKARSWKVALFSGELELPAVTIASRSLEDRSTIPQKIETISSKEIAFQNPLTSADMLIQNGGVFVQKSQMGGGSPVLRGFEANKVLLVVDGVRMNNAVYRGGHLQNVITIDPNLIDRTEVLFGPASVMYGSDALGGVMHFYSKKAPLATDKKVEIHTNALARWSSAVNERTGHIDLSIGLKKISFLTSFTGSGFGDLRMGAWRPVGDPDYGKRFFYQGRVESKDTMLANDKVNVQKETGYQQYDVMEKIYFLTGKRTTHTINFQFSTSSDVPRYDRLSEFSGSSLKYADWYYGPQKRMLASYSGTTFRDSSFFDKMSWTAAYQDLKESRHNRRFGKDILGNRTEKVRVLGAYIDFEKKIKEAHQLSYGAELNWNWVNSTAFSENIVSGEQSDLDTRYPDGGSTMGWAAAYLAHKFTISEKVIMNEGIRFTHTQLRSAFVDTTIFNFLPASISQNHNALSGNLGLTLRPGAGWKLAVLGSTGFRAPNVDDLGKVFDSSPGNVIVPNPNIKPEYTLNGEISIEKNIKGVFKAEITAFYTHYLDALVVRNFQVNAADSILYDGVMSNVQATVNAGKARIYGVSAWMHLRFARYFTWSATGTWTYGQDISNNVPLDHISPFYGRTGIRFSRKGLVAEIYSLFNGPKVLDRYSPSGEDNLQYATPEGTYGWATLNLKAAYTFKKWYTVQAGFENILDQHYRQFASGVSAPGRNIIVGLRFGF